MAHKKHPALFEDRFIESFAGNSIINDQKIAIIELIANAWDAGSTEVKIQWPIKEGDTFSISDNGHGMTETDFNRRFRTLAYDRTRSQGNFAEIPHSHKTVLSKRPTFGRNGKGRLAALAFGDYFFVHTAKEGFENKFKVNKDYSTVLSFQKTGEQVATSYHGTAVVVDKSIRAGLEESEARKEIGMRFLADPHFKVFLNGIEVSFDDIPEENIEKLVVNVPEVGMIKITIIDVHTTDKTTHLHGIAWHVKRRLVGECTWKGSGSEYLIDGRRVAAKRFVFIVEADCLDGAVLPDWTAFITSDPKYKKAFPLVQEAIRTHLLKLTEAQREESFKEIEDSMRVTLKSVGIVPREKWEKFVKAAQEECPSISQDDLHKLSTLLINLENSESKYSLIDYLSRTTSDQLDDLNGLLQKWDIDFAKIVLDEIEYRTTLLEKLQAKVLNKNTDEVQDLQPLFHRGLWIFGPEYETIQFTSNKGMTSVIQELYGDSSIKGSRNRLDFAILPNSTIALYSFAKFDDQGGEIGVNRLTVFELKKPDIPIGDEEKSQPWKYVNELYKKGLLRADSKATCFILGSEIDPNEADTRTYKDGAVKVIPLTYDTVIRRAKSRLLNLHDKIVNVTFLEDTRVRQYLLEKSQTEMAL